MLCLLMTGLAEGVRPKSYQSKRIVTNHGGGIHGATALTCVAGKLRPIFTMEARPEARLLSTSKRLVMNGLPANLPGLSDSNEPCE
jgi:hypothetical protein